MAKPRRGEVNWNEDRKRWLARYCPTDKDTGKEKDIKRYGKTKTEAWQKLQIAIKEYEKDPSAFSVRRESFLSLTANYRKQKLVPAKYVGERKIGGRRRLDSPNFWLRQLEYYFKDKKASQITKGAIEGFILWLADLPPYSTITPSLELIPGSSAKKRSLEAINRPLSLLRAVLNYGVEERIITREQNPFLSHNAGKLIDTAGERSRERYPSFGEEIALLEQCVGKHAYMRAILICAADTGLRRNEMLSLSPDDIDLEQLVIRLRAKNAKTNKAREIPITARMAIELRKLLDAYVAPSGDFPRLFGVKDFTRAFEQIRKAAEIEDLHFHDYRHAFITRSILAGIPVPLVLKASGHGSEEWKRYLNISPTQLRRLLAPHGDQERLRVKSFAVDVMRALRDALGYAEIGQLFDEISSGSVAESEPLYF